MGKTIRKRKLVLHIITIAIIACAAIAVFLTVFSGMELSSVYNKLVEETAEKNYNCVVTQTGCIGMCVYEPIVEVFGKDGDHTTYVHVDPEKAVRILKEHIGEGKVVEEYTVEAARKADGNV